MELLTVHGIGKLATDLPRISSRPSSVKSVSSFSVTLIAASKFLLLFDFVSCQWWLPRSSNSKNADLIPFDQEDCPIGITFASPKEGLPNLVTIVVKFCGTRK